MLSCLTSSYRYVCLHLFSELNFTHRFIIYHGAFENSSLSVVQSLFSTLLCGQGDLAPGDSREITCLLIRNTQERLVVHCHVTGAISSTLHVCADYPESSYKP